MRPTRVYPKSLPKYNKLHTEKVRMWCGTEITALHCIKETQHFYISISSWAFCCSTFKKLKYNTELKVDIPILTDENAKTFLNHHAWHDWVQKEKTDRKNSDMIETLDFLKRVFPDKKPVYFYELKSLVSAYCHGSFINYDRETDEIKKPDSHDIKTRKYYTKKYFGEISGNDVEYPDFLQESSKAWRECKDEEKRSELLSKHHDLERDWYYKNHNLTDTFIEVCKNVIVTPYIFTDCCVAGSSYENAGDIYMIVTNDTVYFETERHF